MISIEARANKHDGEKYISLESHKCNEGSVNLNVAKINLKSSDQKIDNTARDECK